MFVFRRNSIPNAMKSLFCTFLAVSLFVNCAYAQLLQAKPETAGFDPARLARIDTVLRSYTDAERVPGIVALVARNGKIVYHKGFGYDDIDNKTPLKADAIFRIASQTKAITSAAIMILFEEGKFLLDDKISQFIPSFKNPQVLADFNAKDSSYTTKPAKREITFRDLLTHTSGISYAGIGTPEAKAIYAKAHIPSGIGTPFENLGEAMTRLGSLPLIHDPGARFTYGLNTDVLGYLVEVISGKTLDAFCKERIFSPLGMKDTYFYLPESKFPRLSKLYGEDANQKNKKYNSSESLIPGGPTGAMDYPKAKGTFFSGGAGLSSTALDYAIFLQTLLNGGEFNGKRILSPATVKLMTVNQIGDIDMGRNKFGLGFEIATAKEAARLPVSEGTFSWGGIFGTQYWADPKQHVVALILTQKFPNSTSPGLTDKFKVLVYQAIVK